jgi:tetratricopeptide (TPR) repeat protein/TolB-like protein
MKASSWDTLSAWFNAWLAADAVERDRLRARLALEQPDLLDEADELAAAGGHLTGFLETPAVILAARELAQEDPLLSVDSMVGPYRIVSLIARGGMGDVYRATDVRLRRDVALKVLAQTTTRDPQRVERFMQEARVTASLDHPHVIRVYDVGRFDDRAYLVAELLEGETLRARIARGAMPVDEVLRIGIEVTRGLAAAHDAGLVHRDLKPDNIFLTRSGGTKILDFGIAKLAHDDTKRDGFATLTGVVLGTAGYLAPEQIRGEAVDPRADLFALGAVLFEMLTGTRAFARDHLVETLHAILHDSPSDALAERGDVPPALVDIVLRLLEKSSEARVQSSADLIAALEGIETWSSPQPPWTRLAHRWRRARRMRKWPMRRARAAAGVSAAVVVTAIAVVGVVSYWWRPAGVTLAVMPFENIPAAKDNALEIGLTDQIISRLGQIPGVRVLPITATRRLSGKDPLEAARELGATLVLTMRLQRESGEIRAPAQLASTTDGQVIWTTMVTTDASRMFTIQDVIVKQMVEQLAPRLSANASTRIVTVGTRSNDAYHAYVRGRAIVLEPTPQNLKRAAELFQQAVNLDPQFADAWAGLGSAFKRMTPVAEVPPHETFPKAKQAAERALAIQPEHAEAHSVLGTVALWYDWNYGEAERRLQHALALQPSSADAEFFLATVYSTLGRHDDALEGIRRARALDLSWLLPRSSEGAFMTHAREYDRALQHLNELLKVAPDWWHAHVYRLYALLGLERYDETVRRANEAIALRRTIDKSTRPYSIFLGSKGFALARLGRADEARAVLEELRSEGRETYVSPYHEATILLALGEEDEAMDRLEAAIALRDFHLSFLGVVHVWDELRDNQRFRQILSQVNLLEVSDRIR